MLQPSAASIALPLATTIAELRDTIADQPGRYRVDLLDAANTHDRSDAIDDAAELRATLVSTEIVVTSRSAVSDPAHAVVPRIDTRD